LSVTQDHSFAPKLENPPKEAARQLVSPSLAGGKKGRGITPTLTLPRPRGRLGIFDKGEGIIRLLDRF